MTMTRLFVWRVQTHCRNSQSKVGIEFSDLNSADVLVVEYRESIRPAIPPIIALLNDEDPSVRKVGVDTLWKLSEQGRHRIF